MAKKKFIFIGLAIILVIALIGALIYLLKTGKIKPEAAAGPSLELQPNSLIVAQGQTFNVNIRVNTDNQPVVGVDLFYLNYDPGVLEVQDADPNQDGVQIQNGTIFDIYMGERVDSHPGKIALSGMVKTEQNSPGWTGSGIFATATFKALKPITASQVYFDFTPGATNDTNIISMVDGTCILANVVNGTYDVTGPEESTHTVCNTTNRVCETISGAGTNECAINADCQPKTHRVCNSNSQTCDTIEGEGTNQCSENTECQSTPPPEGNTPTAAQPTPTPTSTPTSVSQSPETPPIIGQVEPTPNQITPSAAESAGLTSPEEFGSPIPSASPEVQVAGLNQSTKIALIILGAGILITIIAYLIWNWYRKKKGIQGPDQDELI